MANWFECKVRYMRTEENGKDRLVTETYLVDALTFTEAETRMNTEMGQYISGEFGITNIKVSNLAEIVPNKRRDRWFRCKVKFISIDEVTGKESKSNTNMLVQADTVEDAYTILESHLKDSVAGFVIPDVKESPILDVFPYFEEKPKAKDLPPYLKPEGNSEADTIKDPVRVFEDDVEGMTWMRDNCELCVKNNEAETDRSKAACCMNFDLYKSFSVGNDGVIPLLSAEAIGGYRRADWFVLTACNKFDLGIIPDDLKNQDLSEAVNDGIMKEDDFEKHKEK